MILMFVREVLSDYAMKQNHINLYEELLRCVTVDNG